MRCAIQDRLRALADSIASRRIPSESSTFQADNVSLVAVTMSVHVQPCPPFDVAPEPLNDKVVSSPRGYLIHAEELVGACAHQLFIQRSVEPD